jgi:NADH-quinone oxidoreductase subunit L
MSNFLVALIPVLPLLSFLIIGLNYKKLSKSLTAWLACGTVFVSFLLSVVAFLQVKSNGGNIEVQLFEWIATQKFTIGFSFLVDPLSALMLLVVTGVGFLIHVYSIGYMHHDEGFNRFFAYMNLFVFSMLILVLGSNYLMMFIGWEGVGLCSYLLIGFWFKNTDYNNAAKKAFIMNRIGDFGFLLGMFLLYVTFGSLDFKTVFSLAATYPVGSTVIVTATLLLFVGAIGKSAQIPLFTWLPDAMAGPTPVSALIHAATMVTAGVYMVARSQAIYVLAPLTMNVIAVVGTVTALVAATIAIYQNDIKKVLAYSTVSQLGYMFVGLGVGAFTGAMFHLTTHAFFKALLFLGAGSVIHALGGAQDIRSMGGLRKSLPVTFLVFLMATIAISGIPPFSGFFSKDEILVHAFAHNKLIWALGLFTSLLTAFYMFRLLFLTFSNSFRGTAEQQHHLHESPKVMTIPLMILAVLSVFGGMIGIPEIMGGHHALNQFLSPVFKAGESLEISHSIEWALMSVTVAGALLMIAFAWMRFGKRNLVPAADTEPRPALARLFLNKWYFDEIYNAIIVKPLFWLSTVFHKIVDVKIIDGLVNGFGNLAVWTGGRLRYIQTGNIGFYLTVMVLAVVAILMFLMI